MYCTFAEDTKVDTKAMLESLWGGKKMAAHKQIRPVIRRSDKLKQVASPSVKQCLEVYEQPTVCDRYTGKVKKDVMLCSHNVMHECTARKSIPASPSFQHNIMY